MSDALQAADVTLVWAAVGDSGADVELRFPSPDGPVTARFNVKKWDTVKPFTVAQLLDSTEATLLCWSLRTE